MFGHFYNESLRKLTVAFGALFNEIFIIRENEDGSEQSKVQVPITYGSKEKFIRRLEEPSGISDNTKIQITLPRISFEIASINYDPIRHLNKLNKKVVTYAGDKTYETFQEVPYNISFSLYAYTRTMEDNLQIVEQIIPYFSPEFIVSLNLNKIDRDLSVPITLSNVAIQESYEGNMMDRRVIASSFNFVAKTRLYAPIKEVVPIVTSELNFGNILGDTNNILYTGSATGSTSDYTSGDFIYE
jgi:hypothetical protein